jgi:hypothetical protein
MSFPSRLGARAVFSVVALAMLVFAPFAFATKGKPASTEDITKLRGGFTEVTLNPTAVQALQTANPKNPIDVAPTGKAYATKSGAVRFPITRGEIKPAAGLNVVNLAGQIRHAGGLKFTGRNSGSMVVLDRYHINLDTNPDLSARVNRMGPDRIELFDVDFSGATIGSAKGKLTVSGVKLTLSAAASAALTATYGTPDLTGAEIGTAKVHTHARPKTVKVPKKLRLARGWTTVAVTGDLPTGLAIEPVGAAKAGVSGVSFPITRGRLVTETLAGRYGHRGGLKLAVEGKPTVVVRRFVIDTKAGELKGSVFVDGKFVARIPLFALGLGTAESVRTKRFLRVTAVNAALTEEAAGALNGVFGTSLEGGTKIGVAKSRARVLHYGWWFRHYHRGGKHSRSGKR